MVKKLQEFLQRANVSQRQVADAIGYHESAICLVLGGKRGVSAWFAYQFLDYADKIGRERKIPRYLWPTLKDLAELKPPKRGA
jgi:DNA transposition AAA+ family ATPase